MAFQVEIFGQQYTLRSEADEEHVRQVAGLVDARMREVASESRSASALQVAVLAALDLASECIELRGEACGFVSRVGARLDALMAPDSSCGPKL